MKKIFLIIVILLQVGFLFAQERDNVGHRVGPWNFGTPQQGITWKIRRSYYSDNSEKFTNEIEIKNTNNSTITFSYNISENANETTTRYRKTLAPYGTYTSTYCPNAQSVYFYVELSNGQTRNNQTNSSNQQNDPTFDRNNASFQDYYKRATSAGQAGNYDEAISLWNSAIAVAVNDDQRNNARAWLAEVQKAKNNSNSNQNKQQTTYTPPQPTKLQKQANAVNQISDLFSTLTNKKQNEIDERSSTNELEKVKIQQHKNNLKNSNRLDNKKELYFSTNINFNVSFNETLSFIQNLGYQILSQTNKETSAVYFFKGFKVSVFSSTGGTDKGFKVDRYMTSLFFTCESEEVLNDLLSKIICNDTSTTCKCISFSIPATKEYGINIRYK